MQTYKIVRAWDWDGRQIGWDVMGYEDDMTTPNWASRWTLLRDAKQALKLEGIEYTVEK